MALRPPPSRAGARSPDDGPNGPFPAGVGPRTIASSWSGAAHEPALPSHAGRLGHSRRHGRDPRVRVVEAAPGGGRGGALPPAAHHRSRRARLQCSDRRGGCRGDPPAVRDRGRAQAHPARGGEGLAGGSQPLVHRVGDSPGAGLRALERLGLRCRGARFRERPALPRGDGRAGGTRVRDRAGEGRGDGRPGRGRAAAGAGRRSRLERLGDRARPGGRPGRGDLLVHDPAGEGRGGPRGLRGEDALLRGHFRRRRHHGGLPGDEPPPRARPDERLRRRRHAAGPLPGRRAGGRAPLRRGGLRTVRPGAPAPGLRRRRTSASRRGREHSTTRWPERGPTA